MIYYVILLVLCLASIIYLYVLLFHILSLVFYYFYYYFNFLQTVAHSAELVCKGLSIYKVKAKMLQKVHIFKKSKLKSVYNYIKKQLFTNKT